jgi:hypothetical protein
MIQQLNSMRRSMIEVYRLSGTKIYRASRKRSFKSFCIFRFSETKPGRGAPGWDSDVILLLPAFQVSSLRKNLSGWVLLWFRERSSQHASGPCTPMWLLVQLYRYVHVWPW